LLHMEIVQERLEREYNLDLITTAPSVVYQVTTIGGEVFEIDNPSRLPSPQEREKIEEPYVKVEMITPETYVGTLMELCQNRRGVFKDMKYQLDVFDAQVADAKARGAELLAGGVRLPGPGNWYAPTVFTKVNHNMDLMREESFGPLIGIQKVGGDDEAVALMNDTRYGLTAGVFTPDEARARALLSRVHAGSVYWNCCDRVSPRLPWSGVGDSGVGLTLSNYGIQTFTRPKAWHLRKA
ncbi:MAG: aldehyde dehydrogenase family protein, partial [Betaproteobacteria bacterium]